MDALLQARLHFIGEVYRQAGIYINSIGGWRGVDVDIFHLPLHLKAGDAFGKRRPVKRLKDLVPFYSD